MGNISQNKNLDSRLGKYFLTNRIVRRYIARDVVRFQLLKIFQLKMGKYKGCMYRVEDGAR